MRVDRRHAVAGPPLAVLAAAGMAYGAWLPGRFPVFVACALILAAIQLWMWRTDGLSSGRVLWVAVLIRLAALPVVPVLSDDVYRYLWDGYVSLGGINPFRYVPSDPVFSAWHGTELFAHLNSKDVYTVYPPVSQGFFALATGLSGAHPDSWFRAYILLKVLFTVVELSGLAVLSRVLRSRSLMLLAWSPVLVTAGALQGHTDILLVGLLGAAWWAWKRERWTVAVAWITAAAWVKLVPLLMLPFLVRKAPARSLTVALLLSVAVWIPFAAPYVVPNLAGSLDLYVRYFEFNAGPYYALKEWYQFRTGADWSKQLGPALRQGFTVLGLALMAAWWIVPDRLRFVIRSVARAGRSRGEGETRDPAWTMAYVVLALYFLCATTIHPWYLVGPLVVGVMVMEDRVPWHWWGLAVVSLGTYLLYWGGPYWSVVLLGWGLWLVTWIGMRSRFWLDGVMAWRAAGKVAMLSPWLADEGRVLDLGAAEGYVGQRIADTTGSDVTLCDVRKARRVPLEEVIYEGEVVPFNDDYYDTVLLSFVLHHSAHPEQVLAEALRVSRGRVVILESIYTTRAGHVVLRWLDRLANRVRSLGRMTAQESHLHHRTQQAWIDAVDRLGGRVVGCRVRRNPAHRQLLMVVEPAR